MQLKIENLKHIKSLEFTIPTQGVWLLTGLNGSGKTSLLAAIYRMKEPSAFQKYYKTSSLDYYDSFQDSKITYHINNNTVTYKYGSERWRPTPNNQSKLFNDVSFPEIRFIEVNAKRVEPSLHDLQNRPRPIAVENETIQFMKEVLDNNKWDNLKYINYQRGIGNKAYIIPYQKNNRAHYFSEKNFSLGELCVLRLACALEEIQNDSLVLIDEIEIALHPKAQRKLLSKLQDIAHNKNLTVIFSTHSSTLIKSIDRKKLLFLQQEGNTKKFKTINNVYPAQVLGEIAYDEELDMDFLFFVEDDEGKLLLSQIIEKYKNIRNLGTATFRPSYKIIPIGGFQQVMDVLASSSQIFRQNIVRKAFLDQDVCTETLADPNQGHIISTYNANQTNIKFLPCTPEKGIIDLIESDPNFCAQINSAFSGSNLHIEILLGTQTYLNEQSPKPRKQAKKRYDILINHIHQNTGEDMISIKKALYKLYTEKNYPNNGPLVGYLNPIFNT